MVWFQWHKSIITLHSQYNNMYGNFSECICSSKNIQSKLVQLNIEKIMILVYFGFSFLFFWFYLMYYIYLLTFLTLISFSLSHYLCFQQLRPEVHHLCNFFSQLLISILFFANSIFFSYFVSLLWFLKINFVVSE